VVALQPVNGTFLLVNSKIVFTMHMHANTHKGVCKQCNGLLKWWNESFTSTVKINCTI